METITKTDFIATELQKFETEFEITETGLAALKDQFKDLKIEGQDDRAGLKVVETARKTLKSQRVKIKKASESLRESAVRFQKAVIEREKTLISIIEPTEDLLSGLEDDYYAEKERLRLEAEKKESDRIQAMLDQLNEVRYAIDFHELKGLTDEQFNAILKEATQKYEEEAKEMALELEREKQRQADIEKARKEEEERLAKEREEQADRQRKFDQEQAEFRAEQARIKKENDEKAAKLKADQDKLEAEKKAIEDAKEAERQEKIRLANLEQAKKEAAENARIEAEAKAKREAEEKIEKEQLAKEEAEEKLLLSSDKDKFLWIEETLSDALIGDNVLVWSHFKSKKGKIIAKHINEILKQASKLATENK